MSAIINNKNSSGTERGAFKWRLSEPKVFSGVSKGNDLGAEALSWMNKMDRIKMSSKMDDEEILFLVDDYLSEKATTWFNVVGKKATSWNEFVKIFKKQYLVDQEDKWWSQLQSMKQGPEDSIDDIALRMEELFGLLGNKNEAYQVRTFLSAINPKWAYEIEKETTPATFNEAKAKAKQIEKSDKKYKSGAILTGEPINSNFGGSIASFGSSDNSSSYSSDISSLLVSKLEQLSINLVKLNENVLLNQRQSNGGQATKYPAYNNNNRAVKSTGANSDGTGELNYVNTIVDGDYDVNEIYMKRGSPPSVEAVNGSSAPAVKKNKIADSTGLNATLVKKKTVRRKARRLPVSIKKNKIWSRLLKVEAGISLAEWISLDKEAASEIIDGIRYLRESKKKRKPPGVIESAKLVETVGQVNEVEIDDDSTDSYDSDDSYDNHVSSDASTGVSLSDISDIEKSSDDGLEFSDTESIYRYPYSLEEMKSGSPLRGVVNINNKSIECIYDTGASVSVIGSSLVKKLGLVPNGDKLNLVGFNHNPSAVTSSNIVMDVPISINGKIRPEHMCIEENNGSELLLLGIPWFKNYGISLDMQKSLIMVPTTEGVMKIKCFTKHYDED
ncbi:hypothetical protein ABG067_007817, partial [Albugo candida]